MDSITGTEIGEVLPAGWRQVSQLIVSSLAERFDGLDRRLDGMDERFDGLDRRLDGMDERFDGLDRRLDGIDGRLDGIDGRFERIAGQLNGVTTELVRVGHWLDGLAAGQVELTKQLGETQAQVGRLEESTRLGFQKLSADNEELRGYIIRDELRDRPAPKPRKSVKQR